MANSRVVGILGGMGPLATADLYRKIIEFTPAHRDQDHLHVIIDADPTVPDRTEALLRGGEDPTPWLVAGGRRLRAAGAAFIVMPCNTAHAFLPRVQPLVEIPFVSMIAEAAREAARRVSPGAPVGILATSGTVAAALYQHELDRLGLRPIVPDRAEQAAVETAINLVKAGEVGPAATDQVLIAARALERDGAAALIAACTELPIVLRQDDVAVPLIDATAELARAAVTAATRGDPVDTAAPAEGDRHAADS
ncbi:MAG TPA: amino acid racemase [Thermomicrobiaceae bacterium]|nr:amino acid racemase [Thermomicrobiaceae bacterium]